MIFQVLSAPNQPVIPCNEQQRQKGRTQEPCAFYFLFSFMFKVFLCRSCLSPAPPTSWLGLCFPVLSSCCCSALSLPGHFSFLQCNSEGAVPCSAEPEPGAQPMQSTGTGLTSAPFSFSVQGFHRSSQPEVQLPRNSPVYFYWYF